VTSHLPDHDDWGKNVVRRRGRGYHDAAAELTGYLMDFCTLDRRGRISLRNAVEERSEVFDWSRLVGAYGRAHEMTLSRIAAGAGG
jgi:hypothetical protein